MTATDTTNNAALGAAESDRLDPAFKRLAVILMTGVVMVVFDSTIVNVAINTLAHGLHTTIATAQWTISGYVLSLGIVVPIAGWASQRFGAKQTWLTGLTLFTVGSVLSSLAWNIDTLIAFRVLQGIGGGLLLPLLQTLLLQAAGGRPTGRVMATISLPMLIGPILGPVLGGAIVQWLSWRWVFWINVPFSLTGMILACKGMAPTQPHRGAHLDLPGLALTAPGIAAIVYGLGEVGVHNTFAKPAIIISLAVGVVLLAAFVIYARRARLPVISVRLFSIRSFAASASLLFVSGITLYGVLLILPLYYQQVRHQSVLDAGLLLVPQGIGMLLTRRPAGILADRFGPRPTVLAGLALVMIGTVPFALAHAATSQWLLGAGLFIRGAGLGAITIPVMACAYSQISRGQIADASAATRIAQQVGGSLGTALLATILASQLTRHLAGNGTATITTAFDHTFWWSIACTAVAVIPALLLPRPRQDLVGSPPDQ